MIHHHRKAAPDNTTPEYPGIREVARWPEPTRVLVLTDKAGGRRLRVEMMDSDVTAEALDALVGLLDVIEAGDPEPVSSSAEPSSGVELELVASPPQ